jgi:hypothetical protein
MWTQMCDTAKARGRDGNDDPWAIANATFEAVCLANGYSDARWMMGTGKFGPLRGQLAQVASVARSLKAAQARADDVCATSDVAIAEADLWWAWKDAAPILAPPS